MSKQDKREPHPLEAQALSNEAYGWFEIPVKGGPDSAFVRVKRSASWVLQNGEIILGPDRRGIMLEQVKRRLEHNND